MLKCYIWYCLCLELRIILDTLHKCVRLWTEDVFLFAAKYVNLFFLTLGAFFSIHQIPPKWSPEYCACSLIFSLIEKNAPHAKSCIKILKVCRISGKVQITVRFGYYISFNNARFDHRPKAKGSPTCDVILIFSLRDLLPIAAPSPGCIESNFLRYKMKENTVVWLKFLENTRLRT